MNSSINDWQDLNLPNDEFDIAISYLGNRVPGLHASYHARYASQDRHQTVRALDNVQPFNWLPPSRPKLAIPTIIIQATFISTMRMHSMNLVHRGLR